MTDLSITGGGRINDGPEWPCQLVVTTEHIDVSTEGPKADPKWTHVDAAGHFHAYNSAANGRSNRYPTLRTRVEVVPCSVPEHDGDCDGANVTHWHCVICDAEVEPGMIPGPHYDTMPGLTSWSAKISVPADQAFALLSQTVSLSMEKAFGIAIVTGTLSWSSDDPTVALTLVGTGTLGRRGSDA